MLVTLLALVVMLIGSVALVRSFNTSLFMAGNLAFKRDLVNQAERAAAVVLPKFTGTGVLSTVAARAAHLKAHNYSAMNLPNNPDGVPTALLSDAAFTAWGVVTNDLEVAGQGVKVRYVVDRMCGSLGSELTLAPEICAGTRASARGGSASDPNAPVLPPQVLYRLSVRVDGPRNTQAFFQTTFSL